MPSHAIICLDNSEYMRNGDITPSRLGAQQEAAMKQVNKYLTNPESTVGILQMAGEYPKVLLALGNNRFSIRATLAGCKISSKPLQLIKSMKKAQLAVKKRSDDDHGDRSLIVFVGSPLKVDEDEFLALAARFKKTNLGVTFINFAGEKALASNQVLLQKFVEAVDQDQNSRLVSVPPGPHILSDMIQQEFAENNNAGPTAMMDDDGMDADLAAALRLSLMEHQQAQQAQQGGPSQEEQQPQQPAPQDDAIDTNIDDDLALAIRLSLQEAQEREAQQNNAMEDETSSEEDESDVDDDAELQAALLLSMNQQPEEAKPSEDVDAIEEDDEFLDDIVGNLPGMKKDKDNNNDNMEDEE